MEFRAFVHKRQLNALSQYCYYQYFADLVSNKLQIQQKILDFFAKIKDLIPHENYVIDFAIVNNDRVLIIELNPFFGDTGACLFSWREPKDVNIMKNGPFEFRVLEKPHDFPLDCFGSEWKDFIDSYRGRKRKSRTSRQKTKEGSDSSSAVIIVGSTVLGAVLLASVASFCWKRFVK